MHTPKQTVYLIIGIILETFSIGIPNGFVIYICIFITAFIIDAFVWYEYNLQL